MFNVDQICPLAMHSLHWCIKLRERIQSPGYRLLCTLICFAICSQLSLAHPRCPLGLPSMSFDPWSMDTIEAYSRSNASMDSFTNLGNPFEAVPEQERLEQTRLQASAALAHGDGDSTEPP